MYLTIYFGEKPVFLCDAVDAAINEYLHHPDTVFVDEVTSHAINSLLHEIVKPEFHAGVLLTADLEQLKKAFFRHFTMVTAAGGLVYKTSGEVLLIFRRGKWDLPKGKLDPGESIEACAVREVMEETGLQLLELKRPLLVTYHTYDEYGKHILKDSHWFLMESTGNEPLIPQTEEDIVETKWVPQHDLPLYLPNCFPSVRDVLGLL